MNIELLGRSARSAAPKMLMPDAVQESARQPTFTVGTSSREMTAAIWGEPERVSWIQRKLGG
jgi:hypothetical protein